MPASHVESLTYASGYRGEFISLNKKFVRHSLTYGGDHMGAGFSVSMMAVLVGAVVVGAVLFAIVGSFVWWLRRSTQRDDE